MSHMRAEQLLDSGIMRSNLDLCKEESESVSGKGLNRICHTKNCGVIHIILKFTTETKQCLIKSLHTVPLKTHALKLFSEVHYLSSSLLIYLSAHFWYGCHQMDLFALWQKINIKVLWEDCTVCWDICGKIND